ncbi:MULTISPECIES: tyrosine-type recombinase/integrase [unclassified Streptococcus]|uniref:tyrosine-type recombinase/integrase n=1 Tax=unclassified Streptococcus TaxID=2608887 RepID=UPI00277D095C|nr:MULTISPECIES: tyrosine-type recombinase/integrase [unclassified Streptococcus]
MTSSFLAGRVVISAPMLLTRLSKKAAQEVGLDNIATHSLRKTFGHFMYEQTKDVALIMNLLNHSSQSVSLRYIGKNQDSQDQAMTKFKGF